MQVSVSAKQDGEMHQTSIIKSTHAANSHVGFQELTSTSFFLLGAKVNAARLHETPLHHAAKNMRVDMIEILVEFGANIYARDQHNRKPVDYTTPGSPSAACLQFYESKLLTKVRAASKNKPLDITVCVVAFNPAQQCSANMAPADGKQGSHFTSRKSQLTLVVYDVTYKLATVTLVTELYIESGAQCETRNVCSFWTD